MVEQWSLELTLGIISAKKTRMVPRIPAIQRGDLSMNTEFKSSPPRVTWPNNRKLRYLNGPNGELVDSNLAEILTKVPKLGKLRNDQTVVSLDNRHFKTAT